MAGRRGPGTRRAFLRGLFSGFEGLVAAERAPACRPPGAAAPEARFLALCTAPDDGCRACVDACPERCIIPAQADVGSHPAPAGAPFLLPAEAACTLCGECQPACPTGALVAIAPAAARIGEAVVDLDPCRAGRPQGCDACLQACPFPGIAIRLLGSGDPEIIRDACTGCGLCAIVCPTRSIRVLPLRVAEQNQ